MPTSKISVHRNGQPAANIKITLEYTGLTQSGFTSPAYTNSDGIALVEHSSTGKANVYINGSKIRSIDTPGSHIFHL